MPRTRLPLQIIVPEEIKKVARTEMTAAFVVLERNIVRERNRRHQMQQFAQAAQQRFDVLGIKVISPSPPDEDISARKPSTNLKTRKERIQFLLASQDFAKLADIEGTHRKFASIWRVVSYRPA